MGAMSEDLKRAIRESLVYATFTSTKRPYLRRLIIQEFYASLNRKLALLNDEAEVEVEEAYRRLELLERP
jgi:hypothetical protein